MATQEIVEIFRNHGIQIEAGQSSTYLVRALRETDPETLWVVLEDFTNGQPIGMNSPNEKMHMLTLSYALVDVFENNKETVTQEDIDRAFGRAGGTAEKLDNGSSTRKDDELQEQTTGGGTKKTKANTRKRDTSLRPLIASLVSDNPKASAAEIVEMVQEQKPKAKENTIKVYYSQARKELELPSLGKRGRKSSGLYPSIKKMVQEDPEVSKEDVVAMATEKFDAKENTVAVYISKARKELES